MTLEKLKRLLKFYETYLTDPDDNWEPAKSLDKKLLYTSEYAKEVRPHLLGMCRTAQYILVVSQLSAVASPARSRALVEKANLWLGFIQGAFFMLGDFSLSELQEHSNTRANALNICEAEDARIWRRWRRRND